MYLWYCSGGLPGNPSCNAISSCSGDSKQRKVMASNGCSVTLLHRDLWMKSTTEMKITKYGRSVDNMQYLWQWWSICASGMLWAWIICPCRKMSPAIHISISGLDPDAKYIVVMDIVPVDDNRLIARTRIFPCIVVFALMHNVTAPSYMWMSLAGMNSMIQNGWLVGRQNQPSQADYLSILTLQRLVHIGWKRPYLSRS